MYRIQKRKFSPDVIERNIGTEKDPIWKVYIAPIGNRNDNIAHEIIKTLNIECVHPFNRIHWVENVVHCNQCGKTLHK